MLCTASQLVSISGSVSDPRKLDFPDNLSLSTRCHVGSFGANHCFFSWMVLLSLSTLCEPQNSQYLVTMGPTYLIDSSLTFNYSFTWTMFLSSTTETVPNLSRKYIFDESHKVWKDLLAIRCLLPIVQRHLDFLKLNVAIVFHYC